MNFQTHMPKLHKLKKTKIFFIPYQTQAIPFNYKQNYT